MAGGFLNIAEAAAHLNISEDAIKQLVDQRKLFPLRDTSGLKFKPDELDRYAQDQNDAADTQDDLPETAGSDVSLDGLELDLSADESGTQNKDVLNGPSKEPSAPGIKQESEIGLAELDSDLLLADSESLSDGSAIGATGILPLKEAAGSSLMGGIMDEDDFDVPATLLGAGEGLSAADAEEIASQQQDITNAQSIVLGDEVDLSGIDIDLSDASKNQDIANAQSIVLGDGIDLSGADIDLSDASKSGAADAPKSLLLGDSLAGDLDIEDIVAASDILVPSDSLETDASGSFIIKDSDAKQSNELSGIIDSDPTVEGSNIGSSLSGESGVYMEGGLSLEGGEVKAWDVDLGEFLNDVEEDPDAATMLGTANDFDLDAEGSSAEDPSQSADLASSQAGDSMFDKSAGPGDSSFFGEEVDQGANALTAGSEMLSSSQFMGAIDDTQFNSWQVTGLICCAFLLLLGGLLTFDLVRTIGSAADTSLSNPLVGGLSQLFRWRQ
ncbi:MAG: helix-turn-helix domain-containing protein [Planctomycetaceae bacterium]|nr:helix-turn-helix domain-containing protein [Planctomycetaceae bacterium]